MEPSTAHSLKAISSCVIWCCYGIALLYSVGFSLTSLTVIAGGLSLGVGFGLQHIVNNFVSGLLIIFGGAVRQGDVIQMDSIMAKVLETNVRSTTIQTMDNAIISVPNSDIINSKIINWTRNDPVVKKEIRIGVAYGSDVEKVRKTLLEAAAGHPHVLRNPSPLVFFTQFGDSNLNFSLFVWVDHIDVAVKTVSELNFEIDRRFREESIVMAFPQLEIHMKDTPLGIRS
jgi:small-conductance mechanosensitive channel